MGGEMGLISTMVCSKHNINWDGRQNAPRRPWRLPMKSRVRALSKQPKHNSYCHSYETMRVGTQLRDHASRYNTHLVNQDLAEIICHQKKVQQRGHLHRHLSIGLYPSTWVSVRFDGFGFVLSSSESKSNRSFHNDSLYIYALLGIFSAGDTCHPQPLLN